MELLDVSKIDYLYKLGYKVAKKIIDNNELVINLK